MNYTSWFEGSKKTAQQLGRRLTAVLDLDFTLIMVEPNRELVWNAIYTAGWYRRFHEPKGDKCSFLAGMKLYVDSVALYDLAAFQSRGHNIQVVTCAGYSYEEMFRIFREYGIDLGYANYHNISNIRLKVGCDDKALYINQMNCFNQYCMLFDDLEKNKPKEDRCLFHHLAPNAFFPDLSAFEILPHAKSGDWSQAFAYLDKMRKDSQRIIAARLMHIALTQNNPSAFLKLIDKNPDLTIVENNRTPLELAVHLDYWDLANKLISCILPDEKDLGRHSDVLFAAAFRDKTEIMELLIRANVSSLHFFVETGDYADYRMIHFLVMHGNQVILQQLFQKYGVEIFKNIGSVSLLTIAITKKRPGMIQFLIRLGMRLTIEQAMSLANEKRWVELTAYLAGVDISTSCSLAGELLHVAIAQQDQKAFEMLMTKNPDLTVEKDNSTPMQLATDLRYWNFVNLMAKPISCDIRGLEECGYAFLRAVHENKTDTMRLLMEVNDPFKWYFPSGELSNVRVLHFIEKFLCGLSPQVAPEKFVRIYDCLTEKQRKALMDKIYLFKELDWSYIKENESGFLSLQNEVLAYCFYKKGLSKFSVPFSQLCQQARQEFLEKQNCCFCGFFSSTLVLNQFKKMAVDEEVFSAESEQKIISAVFHSLLRLLEKESCPDPSFTERNRGQALTNSSFPGGSLRL